MGKRLKRGLGFWVGFLGFENKHYVKLYSSN